MARIYPFRGVLYNPSRVPLEQVVAPPYDVISPQTHQALLRRHPANCARLILGDGDTNGDWYQRAARAFRQWLSDGQLVQDATPAYYLDEQSFRMPGPGGTDLRQLTLLAQVGLEPFENKVILPHEAVHPQPVEDRFRLLSAAAVNFSPVFGVYRDSAHHLRRAWESIRTSPPLFDFSLEDGTHHRMWRITSTASQEELTRALAPEQILIADGHHRYQTALKFWEHQRQTPPPQPHAWSSDRVLMGLVNGLDGGMVVMPTHRWIREVQWTREIGAWMESLEDTAFVESVPADQFIHLFSGHSGLPDSPSGVIGITASAGRCWTITLKDVSVADVTISSDVPMVAKRLITTLTHRWLLQQTLPRFARPSPIDTEDNLAYTRDAGELFTQVQHGAYALGVAVCPITLDEIWQVVEAGAVLPQKSTYFYPKLLSGLVMNPLYDLQSIRHDETAATRG